MSFSMRPVRRCSQGLSGRTRGDPARTGVGRGGSGGPRRREPLRAGYLGHLTLVANRMEGAAARRPAVRAFLEESEDWLKYAAGPLQVPPPSASIHAGATWRSDKVGVSR